MTYFKVINRATRQEQIMTNSEVLQFFKGTFDRGREPHYKNDINDYAISSTLSPKDAKIQKFIDTIAVSFFSVAFTILISNFIFQIIK